MLSVYLLSLILALIPLQYAGELPANGISDLLSQISASSELRDIGARSSTEVDGCVYDYVIYQDGTVTIIGIKGGAGDYTVPDVLDGHPVTALGTFSLYGNEALTRVKVPEGVVRIEDYAFGKCTALTAVEFPGSLADIGKNPFISCPALTSVILPDAHPDLYVEGGVLISRKDARAISCLPGLDQTACAVPEGIEIIDDYAFTDCYFLEEVTFPDSLLVIREGAFYACTGLKAVKLPKKVSALGSSAFCGCSSLTAVLLPASLTGLGSNPFADCPRLTGITVSPGNEYIACENGALISRADRRLIYYPIAGGRESYQVPEGIVEIGESAFLNCTDLKEVILPGSTERIGVNAFFACSRLESVEIPDTVSVIDEAAFSYCHALRRAEIPGSLTGIPPYLFYDCPELPRAVIPDGVKTVGHGAFYNCAKLKDLVVGSSVETIEEYAFNACTGLTGVKLPESLKKIGYAAFWDCRAMLEINIPAGVWQIGEFAFYGCPALTVTVSQTGLGPHYCEYNGIPCRAE